MTPEQLKLARHALGLDNPDANGRSYRNRYVAGAGSDQHAAWSDMEAKGLAYRRAGNDLWFALTAAGATAALDPGETLDPEDFPLTAAIGGNQSTGEREHG